MRFLFCGGGTSVVEPAPHPLSVAPKPDRADESRETSPAESPDASDDGSDDYRNAEALSAQESRAQRAPPDAWRLDDFSPQKPVLAPLPQPLRLGAGKLSALPPLGQSAVPLPSLEAGRRPLRQISSLNQIGHGPVVGSLMPMPPSPSVVSPKAPLLLQHLS